MDSRSVVAWMQIAAGAFVLRSSYADWRALRTAWKTGLPAGVSMIALGVQVLTSGWVHYAASSIAAAGCVWVTVSFFTARDRLSWWFGLVMGVLILPIPIVELLFDDLSAWQRAAMAGVAAIAAMLVTTMAVRLVRNHRRVALPSV
jgi:hypothetical protein